jgi:hypothetical protein
MGNSSINHSIFFGYRAKKAFTNMQKLDIILPIRTNVWLLEK